jgi:hypothetical protein
LSNACGAFAVEIEDPAIGDVIAVGVAIREAIGDPLRPAAWSARE